MTGYQSKLKSYAVDKDWEPLIEDDGFGNFKVHQHITPHIGFTAKKFLPGLLHSTRQEAPEPRYNYTDEAMRVVEEVRETVTNSTKVLINFMDNKLKVRGVIQGAMRDQFIANHSFEDQMAFIYGLSIAEHDAILRVRKEKVLWDLVRPTSVIKRWGNKELITFSGDKETQGLLS